MKLKSPKSSSRRAFVDKAQKSMENDLKRIGFYIRRIAKNSLKNAKGGDPPSQPGKPPRSRTGYLKNFLRSAWDPITKTVVIGPMKIKHTGAPSALEHGGNAMVALGFGPLKSWTEKKIKARPFMWPALMGSLPKTRQILKDSMKSFTFEARG